MKTRTRGLLLLCLAACTPGATALEESLDTQTGSDSAAAASQARIDSLADQTSQDLQRYRIATQRLESLEIYNQQR